MQRALDADLFADGWRMLAEDLLDVRRVTT
jgi:hypothetical protein